MKPARSFITLAAATAFLAACGSTKEEGETAESSKPAFTGSRVWSVGGMTVGSRASAMNPISEEPMGPDASLAGPGALEAALAASPAEPLPEGAAPTLDANIMPDGNPGEAAEAVPQSPFDPALQNPATGTPPPAGESVAPPPPPPAPETPAPGTPAGGAPTPGS